MAYIDKEKFKRKLHYIFKTYRMSETITQKVKCALDDTTVDVVEVKRGKWEIKRDDYDCEYMMCSCCKEEFYPADDDTVDTTPKYCPNCGAKMDERKDA